MPKTVSTSEVELPIGVDPIKWAVVRRFLLIAQTDVERDHQKATTVKG